MSILIKNGRVLDPSENLDQVADILIEEDTIKKVSSKIRSKADQIIDAKGCYVFPGLIDLHVHLRDPGLTYKEDIGSGSAAAAKGGFTTIVAMPNTKPVIDCATRVEYVKHKAEELSPITVLQVGAVTKGQQGEELADIVEMVEAGACAISEDGKSVMNAQLYKEGMQIAMKCDIPVLAHCEDIHMVNGGCMNDDSKARELGVRGISNAVEDVIVARDILLAKDTGARLHLCHCSTKDSVKMVELAKEDGIAVTAEVCPHHFILCSEDIPGDDGNYKMNPPLRSREDMEAMRQGLKDNIIDVISTDHAPHSADEKKGGMEKASFGIVGLETSAALTYTELVDTKIITPMQMAEKMSYNPAKVLGIDRGTLQPGKIADITIFDPTQEYAINVETFVSKGHNTPFQGRKVKGKVVATIHKGTIAYKD